MQNHVYLNSSNLNTYRKIRSAVEAYVNMKVVEDPMGIVDLGKGKNKGKDKGKGKGKSGKGGKGGSSAKGGGKKGKGKNGKKGVEA